MTRLLSCSKVSHMTSKVLLLITISTDIVFGCISFNSNPKNNVAVRASDSTTPFHVPLQTTLQRLNDANKQKTKEEPNDQEIIEAFKEFLHRQYSWNLRLSDLEFLWSKLKEFSLVRETTVSRTTTSRSRYDAEETNPNVTAITMQDIDKYLENDRKQLKIQGILGSDSHNRIVSRENHRYFSKFEMLQAMQATSEFHKTGCNPSNSNFCVQRFLRHEKAQRDIFQAVPPAIRVQRCPSHCSCIQPNEACLPTGTRNRAWYILTTDSKMSKSTWVIYLSDHTGCRCRHRCHNRKCIKPFELVHTRFGDCHCRCLPGKEKRCSKLLEGFTQFDSSDYSCLVNATCLMPQCRVGPMSEENLYSRRCDKQI